MIWLDAHLSPRLAKFVTESLGHDAMALRDLNLLEADDREIYAAARTEGVIFITKDSDFPDLVGRLGPPPYVIWLTCGNTTEKRLQEIFREHLGQALTLIREGEPLVEISA